MLSINEPPVKVIKEWNFYGEKISLLRKGDALKLSRYDKLYSITIPPNSTTDAVIAYVLKCDPIFNQANQVKILQQREWTYENKNISFVPYKMESLMVRINDPGTGTDISEDLFNCTIPSFRCHSETKALMKSLASKPQIDLIDIFTFMEDFTISSVIEPHSNFLDTDSEITNRLIKLDNFFPAFYIHSLKCWGMSTLSLVAATVFPPFYIYTGISTTDASLNVYRGIKVRKNIEIIKQLQQKIKLQRLKYLELSNSSILFEIEPISTKSRIDESVRISKFRWAVCLIAQGGDDNCHASIIVEGLNNGKFDDLSKVGIGKYFMFKSDLKEENLIRSNLFKGIIKYDQRTHIWKIASEKAIILLQNIQKQIRMIKINNINYYVPFDRFGPSPDKPNVHNCFTWAREKLKEAEIVDLGTKTFFWLLPARVKNYTEFGNSIGGASFSTKVWWNNTVMNDELDDSESTILDKESV